MSKKLMKAPWLCFGEITVFLSGRAKCAARFIDAFLPRSGRSCREIKTINLKFDRPVVLLALQRLDRELASARAEKCPALKVIYGYGSTGAGGDIRVAVQKRLRELVDADEIAGAFSARIGTKRTMKPGASCRRERNARTILTWVAGIRGSQS